MPDQRPASPVPVPPSRVNDFAFKMGTVNGTGSASANTLLMQSIFRMGIPVSGKNVFPSNIQGLATWYEIRVSKDGYTARPEEVDLVVALNTATYAKDVAAVRPGGFLMYDSSWPLDDTLIREGITIIGIPFGRMCVESFEGDRQRTLLRNIVYVGSLAALLEIDMDVVHELLREKFSKKKSVLDANFRAIKLGYDYAKEHYDCPLPFHLAPMDETKDSILLDGNSACALGAVYAGATVGAWYPITPSTSLMEAFKEYSERFRIDPETKQRNYALIQAEDELAAAGMVIGAGWAGARAFTSTAGPGISLMSEFIGLAYYTEIPGVFFDIQRTGPSTGMPTRTQQGDLLSIAYLSHGDTKHIALFPANPEECFYLAVDGVRSRRAFSDAGVRGVGSRHRHERLDVPAAQVGRRLSSRPRQGPRRRGARYDQALLAIQRRRRRRHRGAHAAGRSSARRVFHARLGPRQARRVHRGLGRVSGSRRPVGAQARHGGDRGARAGDASRERERRGGRRHHLARRLSRRGARGGRIACARAG